jgi:hypothetical protein
MDPTLNPSYPPIWLLANKELQWLLSKSTSTVCAVLHVIGKWQCGETDLVLITTEVLEIQRGASKDEIRQAYRKARQTSQNSRCQD